MIWQLLFEVSLFSFHNAFALQHSDCYYYKYHVKQTASLYLSLPLKPELLSAPLLFFKR